MGWLFLLIILGSSLFLTFNAICDNSEDRVAIAFVFIILLVGMSFWATKFWLTRNCEESLPRNKQCVIVAIPKLEYESKKEVITNEPSHNNNL